MNTTYFVEFTALRYCTCRCYATHCRKVRL